MAREFARLLWRCQFQFHNEAFNTLDKSNFGLPSLKILEGLGVISTAGSIWALSLRQGGLG